jgi:hypothetical protein
MQTLATWYLESQSTVSSLLAVFGLSKYNGLLGLACVRMIPTGPPQNKFLPVHCVAPQVCASHVLDDHMSLYPHVPVSLVSMAHSTACLWARETYISDCLAPGQECHCTSPLSSDHHLSCTHAAAAQDWGDIGAGILPAQLQKMMKDLQAGEAGSQKWSLSLRHDSGPGPQPGDKEL